jgi:pimeloyl-ACP methyl ester carboxylesterase
MGLFMCLLLWVFQRKLIYMGYAPHGSRKEQIDYKSDTLDGLTCEEIELTSEPKIRLCGVVVERQKDAEDDKPPKEEKTIVMYMQGNAGNPVHRLPAFKALIGTSRSRRIVVVAVAPRSFWKSTSKTPTQESMVTDYRAVLSYILDRWPRSPVVMYGHSLGTAVASHLLYELDDAQSAKLRRIQGLILENPFTSITAMVKSIHPDLWPRPEKLLKDKWNTLDVMRKATSVEGCDTVLGRLCGRMLLINSERDEFIPVDMGKQVFEAAQSGKKEARGKRVVVRESFHEDAWSKHEWGQAIRKYFQDEVPRIAADIKLEQ